MAKDKIKTLQGIIHALDEESASTTEVARIIAEVLKTIQEVKLGLEKGLTEAQKANSASLQKISNDLQDSENRLKDIISSTKSGSQSATQSLSDQIKMDIQYEVDRIEKIIASIPAFDATDIKTSISDIQKRLDNLVFPVETGETIVEKINKGSTKIETSRVIGLERLPDIERMAKANANSSSNAVPVTTTHFYSNGQFIGRAKNINIVGSSTVTVTGDQANITASGGGGGGTVTSVATGTGLTGGTITATGTISLDTKLAPMDTLTGNSLKVLRVNAGETAVEYATAGGGTVTAVSVATANGFAGTSSGGATPALTLTTSVTGVLKGNGTAISAATAGTDYTTPTGTEGLSNKTITTSTITGYVPTTRLISTGNGLSGGGDLSADRTLTIDTSITVDKTTAQTLTNKTLTTAILGSSTATTQSPSDNSTKVATTAYVDAAVLGQNFKEAAKYASTVALPAVVYANGSSGVGATLTEVGFGAISLDGNTPSIGDRVLIKNQVSTFQNGIYTVTIVGTGAAVFVLTRALDANQTTEFKTGDSLFVTTGTVNSNTTWTYNSIDSPVIGTDAITYAQSAGQGTVTAGNGIAVTGLSVAIDTSVTVDKTTAQTLTNKTLTTPIISSISNTGTVTLPTATDTLIARATTDTLSNKRVTRRVVTTTQSATPTINTDNTDVAAITGLAQAITSMTTNLSGTPVAGDLLMIQITDNGTARAITWGASFEGTTVALPTTTVISTMLRVGFQWNTTASKWDCIAVDGANVSLDPGEGHINLDPWMYDSISAGTWAYGATAGEINGGDWDNSSFAQNDSINYKVYLAAGTYTFCIYSNQNSNRGIMTVSFNGTSVGTLDTYAAGPAANVRQTITGIVVATSGIITINIKVGTKNASSSGYILVWSTMAMWRTA